MIISSRQRLAKIDDDPKISLDGIDIKKVKQAKTLGIVIDKRALFMYKIRNNEFPECLTSMFNTSNNKNYNLRSNKLDFALPKPNTNYLEKKLQLFRCCALERSAKVRKR
jgi:hypothetical protein